MAAINTLILSVKVTLISTGVFFIALLLTHSLPQLINFATSELPNLWSSFRSLLRPPYLYLIINGIIITIAASSCLHNNQHKHEDSDFLHHHHRQQASAEVNYAAKVTSSPEVIPAVDVDQIRGDDANRFVVDYDSVIVKDIEVVASPAVSTAYRVSEASVEGVNYDYVDIGEGDELCGIFDDSEDAAVMTARSTCTASSPLPPVFQEPSEYLSSTVEKPPSSATARFVQRRRSVGTVPEGGKALRVVRHLKKSDTWENYSREVTSSDPPPEQLVTKSESLKDHANYSVSSPLPPPPSSLRLKKEPSLCQDELNLRVEAFINKFKEDIRLQRQHSFQQFMEMINRGDEH